MKKIIPYGHQSISEEDIQAVVATLKSDYLTQGPAVHEFEQALCAYTGAKYCVAVSNGTAALHIAVAALQLPENSEGITSPITFTASASAMVYCGVTPCFADIDPETICLDPLTFKGGITDKTRLVIPVHFAGRCCDMASIHRYAKERGIRIIEDAAHAIGSEYQDGGRVGSCKYSDMTIFSFHPVKTITTGEGGAVTTNDLALYERLKLLRSHGITKDERMLSKNPGPWYYEMQSLGFNYRLSDIQAALGVSQLKRVDLFKKQRLEIVKAYHHALKPLSWIKTPCETFENKFCYHLYVVKIDWRVIGKSREQVMSELKSKDVLTQVHYIPVHMQPFYRENFNTGSVSCPHAGAYYECALTLPLYSGMTSEDVKQVVNAVWSLA